MLQLKNVTYTYAHATKDAVLNLNLTVKAGELMLITGPSGCGKTTLMRLVNGLAPQIYGGSLEGSVTVDGFNTAETPVATLSNVVGTLFQDPEEQFFALNVKDEIAFALRSHGLKSNEIDERVNAAAAHLGISSLLTHDIHALSEGQKQKVGLASLLALRPKLLVLDEPSANLDPEATRDLAKTLAMLKAEGLAILVVDHRLYWLRDVADRVAIMQNGLIVREGAFDLLENEDVTTLYGLRAAHVNDCRPTLKRVQVNHQKHLAPTDHDRPVLTIDQLAFSYDPCEPIFDGASFAVSSGITALIGRNGTGKTTLARILTGLIRANGVFTLKNTPLGRTGLMPHAGLVLQNADHQLQMRTVYEEVMSAITAGRLAKGDTQKRFWLIGREERKQTQEDESAVRTLLGRLRLAGLAERHPQSLSGGEKQRLLIACAIAKAPDILILDEPTSGLDGANMATMAAILREQANAGRAVFLITHDLELLSTCDRALDMTDLQPTF